MFMLRVYELLKNSVFFVPPFIINKFINFVMSYIFYIKIIWFLLFLIIKRRGNTAKRLFRSKNFY